MTPQYARDLQRNLNEKLKAIEATAPTGVAVNWADLRVTDILVERSLLHDEENYIVLISEADPSAAPWLRKRLREIVPPSAIEYEVRCEW